eukprot:1823867-Pleurochrysis_carterae.AAC.3
MQSREMLKVKGLMVRMRHATPLTLALSRTKPTQHCGVTLTSCKMTVVYKHYKIRVPGAAGSPPPARVWTGRCAHRRPSPARPPGPPEPRQ